MSYILTAALSFGVGMSVGATLIIMFRQVNNENSIETFEGHQNED